MISGNCCELVKAWHTHDSVLVIPPDEDEILHARRLVAQRCLYGVDKNPMAVDLAKLSLWLATLAKDHPFTFLDHSLRCGDSLVGLTQEQIAAFHWHPPKTRSAENVWFGDPIAEKMKTVTAYRQRILASRDNKSYEQLRQELGVADDAMSLAKLTGDLVIAAFFSADKDRQRIEQLNALARQLVKYMSKQGRIEDVLPLEEAANELRTGDRPIEPFHWEIEFPEVFGRENSGFDAMVGNPPFAGKNTLINSHRDGYLDWLKTVHEESHGNADLVAHFYRRAFNLLRQDGCFGLIATNTIGQGDTRSTGLRWICTHGGTIFAAQRRYKWPGVAAVIVSVVHVAQGMLHGSYDLDGRHVPIITAYLFHAGGHENPYELHANAAKCYQGSVLLGMGFTFDDIDTHGVANSISQMQALIEKDPRNARKIFPYIGGEEVNNHPQQIHHRYTIDFADMSEEEARAWPELMTIVEEKVKPDRLQQNREVRKKYWWRHAERAKGLYESISKCERVLAINCGATPHMSFTFLPAKMVFANTLDVSCMESNSAFCVLQSRVHEIWARFFASSMKDDLRYTPSDCFETFPFPKNFDTNEGLEAVGKAYYGFRAQLMVTNNEGLTKTYNRFHDPHERSPEIKKLRELHDTMDRAVLDAYGWTDLVPTCEFLLDYEEDEDEEDDSSRRKKPWRYRWPEDVRDAVLARLLDLNQQRAEEERLAGLAALQATTGKGKEARGKTRKKLTNVATDAPLFDMKKAGGES